MGMGNFSVVVKQVKGTSSKKPERDSNLKGAIVYLNIKGLIILMKKKSKVNLCSININFSLILGVSIVRGKL